MRRPTPNPDISNYWLNVMSGIRESVYEDEPQPGYYRTKLCTRGPWVPARIWLHQEIENGELTAPEVLRCEVNQRPRDPVRVWARLAGDPISRQLYHEMINYIDWCGSNKPSDPVLRPHRPIEGYGSPPRPNRGERG